MLAGLQEPKLVLNDEQTKVLAQQYGTPLYVFSEPVFRQRICVYRQAFSAVDTNVLLGYASKANSTLAVLKIAAQEGCLIDVASEGELRAALAAGIPASQCYLHGNNKSPQEILFALESGISHIVVDNFEELDFLVNLNKPIKIVVRLAPGVDPVTHKKIRTGQNDTKFGLPLEPQILDQAARKIKGSILEFYGLHAHVGSQLMDESAQLESGLVLAEAAHRLQTDHNLTTRLLNIGGGLGVSYTPGQTPLSFAEYNQKVVPPVRQALDQVNPKAVLMQEPGRSLAADAGVTLYQIGAVKPVTLPTGPKTFVIVDGGLADNPRPGLYNADYTVQAVLQTGHPGQNTPVTVAGRHCETDILFPQIELPENLRPGDLLQVLTTGAYNASMASNYNRYRRPAMVLLRKNDKADLVHRPETWEEMIQRETLPEGL